MVTAAGGNGFVLAVKTDGTVVAWGNNTYGQCNVPAGQSNVVAVAAGQSHSIALKSDGTMVSWGWNAYGQTNVPAGLNNVIAIAAGSFHSLALASSSDPTIIRQPAPFYTNVTSRLLLSVGAGITIAGLGLGSWLLGLAGLVAVAAGTWRYRGRTQCATPSDDRAER